MFIPPHLSLRFKPGQRYYKRFKSVETYQAILIHNGDPEKTIKDSLFIFDIDFVLRNRDLAFFKKVLKSYYPYYYNADFLELISLIAERKNDFKPYIDYIYEMQLDGFIQDSIDNPKNQDLLSWLHILKKDDIIDYLINHTRYPKKIFEKEYSPDYRIWAIRNRNASEIKFILDNYEYDSQRMANAVLSMEYRSLKNHIEIMELFFQYDILKNDTEMHFAFIFENKRKFTSKELTTYLKHFNLNIYDDEFESLLMKNRNKNDCLTHLLNNNYNSNYLKKLNIEDIIKNDISIYQKSLLNLFIKENYRFLNLLIEKNIVFPYINIPSFTDFINTFTTQRMYDNLDVLDKFYKLTKILGFIDCANNYIESLPDSKYNRYSGLLKAISVINAKKHEEQLFDSIKDKDHNIIKKRL